MWFLPVRAKTTYKGCNLPRKRKSYESWQFLIKHPCSSFLRNPIDRRLWYTDAVLRVVLQFIRRLITRTPYPLALQSLISLVLLATVPSALAENGYLLSARLGLLCAVVGL